MVRMSDDAVERDAAPRQTANIATSSLLTVAQEADGGSTPNVVACPGTARGTCDCAERLYKPSALNGKNYLRFLEVFLACPESAPAGARAGVRLRCGGRSTCYKGHPMNDGTQQT